MVSVGDVGVDDGCEAEAGDDDAQASDALGDADRGWHGGGVGVTTGGGRRPQMLAGAAISSQPHTQYSILRNTWADHHQPTRPYPLPHSQPYSDLSDLYFIQKASYFLNRKYKPESHKHYLTLN